MNTAYPSERGLEPLVQEFFSRVQQENAQHVFTHLFQAQAVQQAQALKNVAQPGALHGWLISLKDNIDLQGWTTLAGTLVCAGEPLALTDAPVVARLRQAGAVLVGKTNMSEFAFSAVSVALGLVRAAIGTDTGGSIRIPAALCGLVGFKPTQSRVPRQGVMELSRSLDTVGVIA